jgi:tRNA modification GTPase
VFATDDTIVAIATPPGRGGLGIVRLSGPAAPAIARALLARGEPLEPRRATFGRAIDPATSQAIDQLVATWFEAPHSFTGEHVVELCGHGSPLLLTRLVEVAVAQGARPAEPGEFTLRAYLNGRVDLPQAEAVADLISAVTPLQARAAMDQLDGTLTMAIAALDAALFDLSARLEASLDFPEEGFHFVSREQAADEITRLAGDLARLSREGRAGRMIREGATVAILGRPNAGKSSLFNALAGAARAIVTDVPGTTRDLITEVVDIQGLAVTLVDTAGLREARDAIEAEGVRRARQALDVAAAAVFVIDGSEPLGDAATLLADIRTPCVIVRNKSDLPLAWTSRDLGKNDNMIVSVSAVAGTGLDQLRSALATLLTSRETWTSAPAITNVRHITLVDDARASVEQAREALAAGATEELVLADLTRARQALEQITGRRTADDLLAHIFARFCIGK